MIGSNPTQGNEKKPENGLIYEHAKTCFHHYDTPHAFNPVGEKPYS
jgi:hypothetical protein